VLPGRLALALLVALVGPTPAPADDSPPEALRPPAFEEFVVVPLRVHVLASADLPDVHCGLADSDLARILGKVNAIWHQAGVHWRLDGLIREPAARPGEFQAALEADTGDKLAVYRLLAPEGSRSGEGMDVYYIHKFPVNGVYYYSAKSFPRSIGELR